MTMLGVWSACLAAMARRGAADPKQSAEQGDAEAMPHPRENGRLERGKDHSRTELSASGTPVDDNQARCDIRCDATAQAQRFAHVAAREQDLGAAFTTDTRAAATPSHQGDTVPLLNPHILT